MVEIKFGPKGKYEWLVSSVNPDNWFASTEPGWMEVGATRVVRDVLFQAVWVKGVYSKWFHRRLGARVVWGPADSKYLSMAESDKAASRNSFLDILVTHGVR